MLLADWLAQPSVLQRAEQPSVLPQVAAELSEAQRVPVPPWERQAAVAAQPWAEPVAVQPSVAQAVAAARLLEVQAALAVQHAGPLEVAEVRLAVQAVVVRPLAALAVQPVAAEEAVLSAAQVRPSEARAELPSAEPSVRSGLPVPRLAQRRLTMSRLTMCRRKPGPAKVERRRSQSSSAEGFECSSWGLLSEKKAVQPEGWRPSQRSEMRSVDSD